MTVSWIPCWHQAGFRRDGVDMGITGSDGSLPIGALLAGLFRSQAPDNCVAFVLTLLVTIVIGVVASRGRVSGQG